MVRKPPDRTEDDDDSSEEASESGNVALRLWQIEERQRDVRRRLPRVEDTAQQLARNIEAQTYHIARLTERIDELQKQRQTGGGMFGDNNLVRAVIVGLMALVAALATGQLFNLTGLLP